MNYGTDRQGTTTATTNAAGLLVNTYRYDAWGSAIGVTGSEYNEFRYGGSYRDTTVSMYQMGARYYAPTTGRFSQQDPLPRSVFSANRYAYVGCNPVNHVDPTGLYCDWGFSLGNGVIGCVGGLILEDTDGDGDADIHPYFGSGVVSPGPGTSFACSTDEPTLGWNAGGGGYWGLGGQYGYDSNGVPYQEYGVGTPGYSLAPYYVFGHIDP